MANEKFSIQDAVSYGWTAFKEQPGFFIGLIIGLMVIGAAPQAITNAIFGNGGAAKIFRLIWELFGMFLGMIMTQVALDIHDHGKANFSKIPELFPLIWSFIAAKLLYFVIVAVGLILLIVPGLILMYMFLYHSYLIIDKKVGPIEALTQSRAITDGSKWDLFLFSLVLMLINFVGLACLGIGLLISLPVTMMASVYVYRRLNSSAAPAA